MAELTLAEIAAATGGRLVGPADLVVAGASIDSRSVAPGMLFAALAGERVDGHDFVAAAFAAGAAAALVERELERPDDRALVVVPSVPEALLALATFVRERERWNLVAITGSAGKTTTKELVALLLAASGPTGKSPGNRNNLLGLPEAILQAPAGLRHFVAECGMSHAGELARLGAAIRPDAVVYTNVAPVHLEFFASVDDIARAKAELVESAGARATVIANADDARVVAIAERHPGPRILYGLESSRADVRAEEVEPGWSGIRFRLRMPGSEARVELPIGGLHNLANLLAAAAAAHLVGLDAAAVARAVPAFQPAPHRGRLVKLASGALLLDDCYNSNPRALEAAAESFGAATEGGRRVGILGEMRELGPSSAELHRETGRAIASSFDELVAVGGADARALLEGAREAGFPVESSRLLPTPESAAESVRDHLQPGDRVLLKGSRGVELERAIPALGPEEA